MSSTSNAHPLWSSRFAFILAATGSAVGLGNIWKFPYITGENGGGAFVLVYLACILLIGIPVLIAETLIGRRGRQSPVGSMQLLTEQEGTSSWWRLIGWNGVLASFLVLSFYAVIGGWSLVYVGHAASGEFAGADTDAIGTIFGGLLSSPWTLLLWHSLFMLLVIFIVARGVRQGLEKAITWLMPLLFVLLLVLVGYAMTTGEFGRGFAFLFFPDFSSLTAEGVLVALGHAAFTLSIGIGVMMAYGSYLPEGVNIPKTALTIALLDVVVALLAGLAIFPVVFAEGLQASEGPGLIFQTLPLAFGQMPWGGFFGTLFFILLAMAAVTSAISMLEPVVEWLEERKGISRLKGALLGGVSIWFVGIGTVLSFNQWAEVYPLAFIPGFEARNLFGIFDFMVSNLMMPLGGLAIALFAGWALRRETLDQELGLEGISRKLFLIVLRFVTPLGVAWVFLYNLFG